MYSSSATEVFYLTSLTFRLQIVLLDRRMLIHMVGNATSAAPKTPSTLRSHAIINIISLIGTAIGTSIAFVILATILLRKKTLSNVRLILCTNNYVLVFLLGIFELLHHLQVLQGDFGLAVVDEETWRCRIQAYIVFSLLSAVYLACVLQVSAVRHRRRNLFNFSQAGFCLCRIVYPSLVWLIEPRTYFIILPVKWAIALLLMTPLLIGHGHRLIPGEYICRVPEDDPFSIAYATLVVYGLPFNSLAYIYFRVHQFLRRRARTMSIVIALRPRNRRRDIIVFRRIIITVILLGAYGMPNAVMLIMLAIQHKLVASFYRVLELSFAAAVLTLSVALVYINPYLSREIKMFSEP